MRVNIASGAIELHLALAIYFDDVHSIMSMIMTLTVEAYKGHQE